MSCYGRPPLRMKTNQPSSVLEIGRYLAMAGGSRAGWSRRLRPPPESGSANPPDVEAGDDAVIDGIAALIDLDGSIRLQSDDPGPHQVARHRPDGQVVPLRCVEAAHEALVRRSAVVTAEEPRPGVLVAV